MTHHTDPVAIEAELERDRAQLASTLDALQDRVSVDHMARQALGLIRDNAGAATRAVDGALRANPLALALTGAGLAWLLLGKRADRPASQPEPQLQRVEALSRWEDEGGPVAPILTDDDDWHRRTDGLRRKASDALRRVESEAARGARALRDGVTGARDLAAERAAIVAEFAAGLKESFRHGLTGLSEVAQEKVVMAREAAYAARLRAEQTARTGGAGAARLMDDHPMVTGAVALALGAALAVALPRSRVEDRIVGPERDRLMGDAARLLREERARAARAAKGIGEDLKAAAADAVEIVSAKAGETAEKVTGRLAEAGGTAARAASATAEEIERDVKRKLHNM